VPALKRYPDELRERAVRMVVEIRRGVGRRKVWRSGGCAGVDVGIKARGSATA
jgi:hypothetical protein